MVLHLTWQAQVCIRLLKVFILYTKEPILGFRISNQV